MQCGKGAGAVRTMSEESGKYVERLEYQDDAAMRFSYAILKSPLPIDSHIAHVSVESRGPRGCVVTWDMHWSWLGAEGDAHSEGDLVTDFERDFTGFIATAAASAEKASLRARL